MMKDTAIMKTDEKSSDAMEVAMGRFFSHQFEL